MVIGQNMLKVYALLLCLYISVVPLDSKHHHHSLESCHIGDVIENECVKCLCTSKALFECKPIDCNKTTVLQETNVQSMQACIPNQLYKQKLITCICNKNGTWPHKNCHENFLSLPSHKVVKHTCAPNTYVEIDCNVCRCGSDGQLIPDRCTKNICEEQVSRRSDTESDSGINSVYSTCVLKNWYSLAPCQFCYCVLENKLVCNTGHYYAKKLEVGKYNMEICGSDMLNQALELMPDNQNNLRELIDTTVRTQTVQQTTTPTVNEQKNNVGTNKNNVQFNSNDESSVEDDETGDETDSEEGNTAKHSPPGTIDMGSEIRVKSNINSNTETDSEEDESSNEDSQNDSQDGISENDSKDDHSKAMPVDIVRTKKNGKDSSTELHTTKNPPTTSEPVQDLEFADNTLKINVPNVLNKVFEMALRKSMVSLTNDTNCTPGVTTMHSCNMCFCLKNGKELCTANKCP